MRTAMAVPKRERVNSRLKGGYGPRQKKAFALSEKPMSANVDSPQMRRIAVVGSMGSGKTTISVRLAEILDIPHIELDRWLSSPTP